MHARAVIAAAAAAVLLIPLASTAADAAPVRFSRIQYDSPGSDTGTNRSLNAEWARVKNHGHHGRTLTGWTVRDRAGHVFHFPRKYRLRAGKSVTIHTGSGRNTRTDLYWRQGNYVWNNTGDKAILKNKVKKRVDTCRWGDGPGSIAC